MESDEVPQQSPHGTEKPISRRRWLAAIGGIGGVLTSMLNTSCVSSQNYKTRRERGVPRPERAMLRRRARYR